MRYRLFWDTLSKKNQDTDDARYVEAGLRVMRHVDVYLESGPEKARLATNVRNLSRQLDTCGETPLSALLREVTAMIDRPKCSFDSVIGLLCAYARMLDFSDDWQLAHDVWEVIIDAITTIGIPAAVQSDDTLAYAWTFFAHVTRRMGHYELSRARYAQAIALAERHGLKKIITMAKIGDSGSLFYLGSAQEALDQLDAQRELAEVAGWTDLQAKATLTRGMIFYARGRREDALAAFDAGMRLNPRTSDLDIGVSNIAACAAESGYFEIAKYAHERVFKNAMSQIARFGSAVNLVELAVWMNDREDFVRATNRASSLTFDAHMEAYRRLYTIRGQVHFNMIGDGVPRLRDLLRWTKSHRLADITAEIQKDLARIKKGGSLVPPIPKSTPTPESLAILEQSLRRIESEAESANASIHGF